MRGRPKKIITPEKEADSQYSPIAHCYMRLNTAIQELKDILADVEVKYMSWMPFDYNKQEDRIYGMSNKMVFDNLKWTINDLGRQLSGYLERMLKHADDLKWKDQRKIKDK